MEWAEDLKEDKDMMKMRNGYLKRSLFRVGLVIGMLLMGSATSWGMNSLRMFNKTDFYIWVKNVELQGGWMALGLGRKTTDPEEYQPIPPHTVPAEIASWNPAFWRVGTSTQNEAWYYVSRKDDWADAESRGKMVRVREGTQAIWKPFENDEDVRSGKASNPTLKFDVTLIRGNNYTVSINQEE